MRFFGFPGDFPTNPFPQKGKKTHGETSVVAEVSGDAKSMDSASHEMSVFSTPKNAISSLSYIVL